MKEICMTNSRPSNSHNKHKLCCCGYHSIKAKKKKLNKQNREKIIDRLIYDNY